MVYGDEFVESVRLWCVRHAEGSTLAVTAREIALGAFGEDQDSTIQCVGRAMGRLGYKRKQRRVGGERSWVYIVAGGAFQEERERAGDVFEGIVRGVPGELGHALFWVKDTLGLCRRMLEAEGLPVSAAAAVQLVQLVHERESEQHIRGTKTRLEPDEETVLDKRDLS